jgi:hypothetical protein
MKTPRQNDVIGHNNEIFPV